MQLTLDLNPSLTTQFKTLRQVTAASVYDARGGLTITAGDCDMSPSELTKQLSLSESRKLDVDDFERVLASTGDFRPIYYLIAKFLPSDQVRREAALDRLAALVPEITGLLEAARTEQPSESRVRGGRR